MLRELTVATAKNLEKGMTPSDSDILSHSQKGMQTQIIALDVIGMIQLNSTKKYLKISKKIDKKDTSTVSFLFLLILFAQQFL